MKIVLYHDEGVSSNSLNGLFSLFNETGASPVCVDRSYFLSKNWEENTSCIVIPGGRDIFYQAALEGEGTKRIARYVEGGGKFIGVCAGGYFGADEIEFEKGNKEEICAERNLKFFPGKAIGPAHGLKLFQTIEGVQASSISWREGIVPIYFNGGCFFDEAEKHSNVQILGRYHDLPAQPAAIVLCNYGKGKALLSGVHPEFNEEHLDTTHPHLHAIGKKLKMHLFQRQNFWQYLLSVLGLYNV